MQMPSRWSKQSWLIAGVIVLSAVNAVLGAVVTIRGVRLSESTEMLWYFVFSLLVAVWLKNDIAEQGSETDRQYPHYVIFLFWPLLLPYHLTRSRGIEGVVLFLGFVALYTAPGLVQFIAWASEHAS